jgi:hypothetical protein
VELVRAVPGLWGDRVNRLLSRAGAAALTSPPSIVLAGLGAAVGILAGLPGPAAAAIGAGSYAVAAAVGVARVPRPGTGSQDIDPRGLQSPWKDYVREALDARVRYRRAIGNTIPGPLRERLEGIGGRVDEAVQESWRIARHGDELEDSLRSLDPADELRRRLELIREPAPGSAGANVAESLHNQLRATERITAVAQDARERLRVLDARLDEVVARAVELSLQADDTGDFRGVQGDVDALLRDMEALRQALDETSRFAPPGT